MTFQIEVTENGTFDVSEDGRAVFYDAISLEEAEQLVADEGEEDYLYIHEDGYVTLERIP